MDNQRIQAYISRFRQLIQEERVDKLIDELFTSIEQGKLTWDEVYKHLDFIPYLRDDPSLKATYYTAQYRKKIEEQLRLKKINDHQKENT